MTKHCSCVKICARGLGYIRLPTACLFASTNGILTSIFDSHVSKHCRKEPSPPPTPALPHPRIHLSAVSWSFSFAGLPSPSRSYVTSDVPAAVASAIIAKSPASAGSLFVFKSPFWHSTMSAVFGSSAVTVTGSESGQ